MFLYSCSYIDGAGKRQIRQKTGESAHWAETTTKNSLKKADVIIAEVMTYAGNSIIHVYGITYRDNYNDYNFVVVHGVNKLDTEIIFGELFGEIVEIESIERVDLNG